MSFILLLSLSLFLSNWTFLSSKANQNESNETLQFNPPNNGAPEGNRSQTSANAGSRGDCPPVDKAITALIPQTNWANTLSERPTLWFYIPYQQGRLRIWLKDEDKNASVALLAYQVKDGGIMGFSLPETAPPLEVNRAYRWQVYFNCDSDIEPSCTEVQGIVKRVAADEALQTSLTSANSIKEKINLYAQQGLWQETITELIEFRQNNPNNPELDEYWSDLLSSPHVKLEDFISEPLANCCDSITQ